MDLNTIDEVVTARSREDLGDWDTGTAALAGGTWLFSEPQDHLRRLVDLTGLGWAALQLRVDGLEIAATCTIAEVDGLRLPAGYLAEPLLSQCCGAFLASAKVQRFATVGGNLCMSYPAGPMISLLAALDGQVLVWRPDGSDYSCAVTDLVTGDSTNVLRPGEIVRSVTVPDAALRGRTAFRKIALSPLGRSGAVIIGRLGDDGFTLTVSGSTVRPIVIRWPDIPPAAAISAAVDAIEPTLWHEDAHGTPDWRHAVSRLLALEIRAELAGPGGIR